MKSWSVQSGSPTVLYQLPSRRWGTLTMSSAAPLSVERCRKLRLEGKVRRFCWWWRIFPFRQKSDGRHDDDDDGADGVHDDVDGGADCGSSYDDYFEDRSSLIFCVRLQSSFLLLLFVSVWFVFCWLVLICAPSIHILPRVFPDCCFQWLRNAVAFSLPANPFGFIALSQNRAWLVLVGPGWTWWGE